MHLARHSDAAAEVLRHVLCGWVHGRGGRCEALPPDAAERFVERVERSRLDAFMHSVLDEVTMHSLGSAVAGRWRQAYEQSLLRNMRQHARSMALCARLERSGVPCIGMRGPFFGYALYGDVALRHFTDIDLLVHAQDRDRAWECLVREGFTLKHPFLTRAACQRHHMQWPMRNEAEDVSVDLHWAVDHPYRPYRVDYDAVFRESLMVGVHGHMQRVASPRHALLLACLHAAKEWRTGEPLAEAVAQRGAWRVWLDVGRLMVVGKDAIDGSRLMEDAHTWRVGSPVARVLGAACSLLEIEVPRGVSYTARRSSWGECARSAQGSGESAFTARYGFRRACLGDLWRYLFPERDYFAGSPRWRVLWRRVVHAVGAGARLAGGGLEWGWLVLRRACAATAGRRGIAAVVLALVVGAETGAHEFDDDVGDGPGTAEALSVNGEAIQRVLEIDVDEDWFSFVVEPYVDYSVSVSNGSLFDATLTGYASADGVALAATNTIMGANPAAYAWGDTGVVARAYVRVAGAFAFTTGSYHVAVSSSVVDGDEDGLPDAWEALHFTNMAWTAEDDPDADGMSNRDEWRLMTGPMDRTSCFKVSAVTASTGGVQVAWQSSTGGLYVVEERASLTDAEGWRPVHTNRGSLVVAREYVGNGTQCFFRVVYQY